MQAPFTRIVGGLALVAGLGTSAVAQPADTTHISTKPLFTKRDAWVAAGFLAATVAMWPLDERVARELQRNDPQTNRFLKNSSTGFELIAAPGAYIIGGTLYGIGRLSGNERMADLGWHGTEAVLVSTAGYVFLKGVFGRARPETVNAADSRAYKFGRGFGGGPFASFPSGHTATAFAAASAVTAETSRWWPSSTWYVAPLMYGGATMVGLSRMYNNKHWASDVALGALLGTFSGLKVVQYHHSHPDNRFDKWLLGSADVVPTTSGEIAVVWSKTFR